MGSEKLARRLIDGGSWNVKGCCFSLDTGLCTIHWMIFSMSGLLTGFKLMGYQKNLSLNNGRKLGAMLGSVLEIEDPVKVGYRGYLRL